jgi:signal transduction histidine kinase
LIHNSIKFTPQAGSIKVSLRKHDAKADFSISDTGVGISEEDQERIFERFYKADKSRTRSTGGSGLGLSIVKKIIDLHKGMIQVESKVGMGTTFIVSLPTE